MRIPRTHDLELLLNGLLQVEPLWVALRPSLQALTDYAVDFRYPGSEARKAEAVQAMKDCKAIRTEARSSLGLSV